MALKTALILTKTGAFLLSLLIFAYPTVSTYQLKVPGSCVLVLYTRHIKKPDCLFEVRARPIMLCMPSSKFALSILGAFSQSVPLVRSRCICTGRGCTCALVAATLCKGPLNVFRIKRALYK